MNKYRRIKWLPIEYRTLHGRHASQDFELMTDGPGVTTFFEVHAQESFHGLRMCRAKLEIPGVNYPKNFKEAEKPWIILKNAFTTDDMFLLENESKVYDVLNEAHVWSIPKKFGSFLSMDPSNKDANFAALLLEDKGYSLAHMKAISPGMKFRVTRREKLVFSFSFIRSYTGFTFNQSKLPSSAQKNTRRWILTRQVDEELALVQTWTT
ncbi:hypothetical protein C0995_002627 [Termitomyces sp. Mi166|nr:hypothetical protein C0995_002627 [Termitomyces sp. Mi166\